MRLDGMVDLQNKRSVSQYCKCYCFSLKGFAFLKFNSLKGKIAKNGDSYELDDIFTVCCIHKNSV